MSCGKIVHVMQPTEHGSRDDFSAFLARFGRGRCLGARRSLAERLVGTPEIEVVDVLSQHATQMPLVQDQIVVQTALSD